MSEAKRAAGRAAAELVSDGMRLGLGTGSTVAHLLDALAERDLDIAGVPTSEATARRCAELGIELLDPADVDRLDLCIDGADELDRNLSLTKGGGGALLREKVVATMADRMVVIATPDKVVDRLAETFALPIEVVPFAVGPVTRTLERMGFHVAERGILEGWRTDNGNVILDATMPGGLESPKHTEHELAHVPGIAESGLFVGIAELALLGHEDGTVTELRASR
ncbi:MAG: ribose-5-phosphate isomerase RpiA [Nitriliruptorales bacterium]|nr:ribose-5-phosphate isomerase RpiA [Nitriliruptorales bacterium]